MDGGKQAGTQAKGLGMGNDSGNGSNAVTSFSCIPKKCLACLGLRCVHYLARATAADESQKIKSR